MKLDELRRRLRSNLESEAQPTAQARRTAEAIIAGCSSVFVEAELARICIACGTKLGTKLDADEPETHVLCRECAIERYFRVKETMVRACDGCGLPFKLASLTSEETTCPVCSL